MAFFINARGLPAGLGQSIVTQVGLVSPSEMGVGVTDAGQIIPGAAVWLPEAHFPMAMAAPAGMGGELLPLLFQVTNLA